MELDDVLNEGKLTDNRGEITDGVGGTEEKVTVSTRQAHREKERAAKEVPEEKPEIKEAPRDETGKFKSEKPPEKQEMSEKERALLATATDERRKRQELERQLAEYRAKPETPAPQEPPKAFWDDPEGAVAKINKQIQDARTEDNQKLAQVLTAQRLNFSEMLARQKYQDFEEHVGAFKEMLESTPGLYHQFMAAPDPAEFAYKTGKTHKEIQAAGSLDELRARIEKETRIKLEQEYKEKHDKLLKEKAEIPDTLSTAPGTVQRKVAWAGPSSLENILGK